MSGDFAHLITVLYGRILKKKAREVLLMDASKDSYLDLVKRIEGIFHEMDSDILVDLGKNNEEYIAVRESLDEMKERYPFIEAVLEGEGAISLTIEEHKILTGYFSLHMDVDEMERQQIYFRGHTDCIAYLKRIDVI